MKFEIGDVVQLKSGGSQMVISDSDDTYGNVYDVYWFKDGILNNKERLKEVVLKKVEETK